MDPWIWAFLLLVLAAMFAVFESFIPSGGILAFLALLLVGASIIVGFMEGPAYGLVNTVVCLIGIPVAGLLFAKYWGKTPIGRRILIADRDPEDVLPDMLSETGLKQLIGRTGTAKTKMLLAGAIEINGQTYDAFSDGAAIMPGATIQVMQVLGTRITVREISLTEVTPDDPPSQPINAPPPARYDSHIAETTVFDPEAPANSTPPRDDTTLSRTLESMDIEDPFIDE